MITGLSCSDLLIDSDNTQTYLKEFDQTWDFVNTVYPYFSLKNVDWDDVYAIYRPKVDNQKGDEFYNLLINMLAELKDGHIYIKTPGGQKISVFTPPRKIKDQYAYNPLVVRNYFDQDLFVTAVGGMEYGITKNNIGYIYISSFGSASNFIGSFQGAMNSIRNTDGLILDVRHNRGGDGVNANYVVSRFIVEPLISLDSYVLGEKTDSSSIQPSVQYGYFNPVIVLINGVSYSAAESFAEMMKQVENVTVIGDTTGGGSAGYYSNNFPASGNLDLSNGILVHVGTMDIRRYDGLPFEGIGISPDILIRQSEDDILSGHDLQLEAAIELLNNY